MACLLRYDINLFTALCTPTLRTDFFGNLKNKQKLSPKIHGFLPAVISRRQELLLLMLFWFFTFSSLKAFWAKKTGTGEIPTGVLLQDSQVCNHLSHSLDWGVIKPIYPRKLQKPGCRPWTSPFIVLFRAGNGPFRLCLLWLWSSLIQKLNTIYILIYAATICRP